MALLAGPQGKAGYSEMYLNVVSSTCQDVKWLVNKRNIQLRPMANYENNGFRSYENLVNLSLAIDLIKKKNTPGHYSRQIDMDNGITVISTLFLKPSEVKSVLVVKLDFWGDIIFGRPAITRLKERLPNATISVLCGSMYKDFIKTFDYVDHVIAIDHVMTFDLSDSERLELQRKLSTLNPDIAIDLRRQPETRWILGLSGAPLTIGYETVEYNPTISLTVDSTRVSDHLSNYLVRLVDAIPLLPVGSKDRVPRPRGLLSVGIHPGSGHKAKCWPVEYFSQLVGLLLTAGLRVILFGGPGEREMNQQIIQDHANSGSVVDMSGAVSIANYAEAVANQCNIYVGNDTGPTHIAAVAGVPVIAIFSGGTNITDWFPPGHIVEVLIKAMPCMPCGFRECPYNNECIVSVKPAHVFARVAKLAREVFSHEVVG